MLTQENEEAFLAIFADDADDEQLPEYDEEALMRRLEDESK